MTTIMMMAESFTDTELVSVYEVIVHEIGIQMYRDDSDAALIVSEFDLATASAHTHVTSHIKRNPPLDFRSHDNTEILTYFKMFASTTSCSRLAVFSILSCVDHVFIRIACLTFLVSV